MVVSDDAIAQLRSHGLNVTAQRLAVLHSVASRPHATADQVAEMARATLGSISRQSVYDTLGTLTDKGLLRRIQPVGSPARFETRVGDNHHHLLCRTCGRVEDVACATGHAPCLEAVDNLGFIIDEAEVVYWGLCPACVDPAEPVDPTSTVRDAARTARRAATSRRSTTPPTTNKTLEMT